MSKLNAPLIRAPHRCGAGAGACLQRGGATLFVVLILTIGMLATVLYAGRSFIFEQRTSANQYYSTVAFEAAEAGLQWATAMLNKGEKIGVDCETSTAAGDTRFKDKYLTTDPTNGTLTVNANNTVIAACVGTQTGTGWNCSCPAPGTMPNPTVPTVTRGGLPGFAVAFQNNTTTGTVNLASYGCDGAITSTACSGDAAATVHVSLGSIHALSAPPSATLTVKEGVDVGDHAMVVVNSDPAANGITVDAGGGVNAPKLQIYTVPGTPPWTTVITYDPSLSGQTTDQMFASFFGMSKDAYKNLPSVTQLSCPCTDDDLLSRYASGDRQFWLNGSSTTGLTISGNRQLGTQGDPIIVVVDGTVNFNGGPLIYALLYSTYAMTGGNASPTIVGGVVTEASFQSTGTPRFVYDATGLRRLKYTDQSMVPIAGSWSDF